MSKYPSVLFDIAILADKKTPAQEIFNRIKKSTGQYFQNLVLFDEYSGKNIPDDKKSLAFKVTFGSMKETLKSEVVRQIQDKIVSDLSRAGFELRPG